MKAKSLTAIIGKEVRRMKMSENISGIEENLLEKELHIRTSDFEKGFIAIQQLTEVLELSKKMRIIIDYDPQKAMTEIRYFKIEE